MIDPKQKESYVPYSDFSCRYPCLDDRVFQHSKLRATVDRTVILLRRQGYASERMLSERLHAGRRRRVTTAAQANAKVPFMLPTAVMLCV